jgi:hypothetical protein
MLQFTSCGNDATTYHHIYVVNCYTHTVGITDVTKSE